MKLAKRFYWTAESGRFERCHSVEVTDDFVSELLLTRDKEDPDIVLTAELVSIDPLHSPRTAHVATFGVSGLATYG